jgi:hypothetical protein
MTLLKSHDGVQVASPSVQTTALPPAAVCVTVLVAALPVYLYFDHLRVMPHTIEQIRNDYDGECDGECDVAKLRYMLVDRRLTTIS